MRQSVKNENYFLTFTISYLSEERNKAYGLQYWFLVILEALLQ